MGPVGPTTVGPAGAIATRTALAICTCLAVSVVYVASLYVWGSLRRNDPGAIKRRLVSTAAVSCVAWLPLLYWRRHAALEVPFSALTLAQQLGLRLPGLVPAAVLPVLLTAVLFVAPLLYSWRAAAKGVWQPTQDDQARALERLQRLRNYVAAPLTEEWVFRACMVPLLRLQGMSAGAIVFTAPVFFGTAHLHHALELVRFHGATWRTALLVVLVQFAYTSVFGWFATFLFLRTQHVLAPVVAHAFCNYLGFPPFKEMLLDSRRVMYASAIAGGIVGFGLLLQPLTAPKLYAHPLSAV